MIPWPASLKLQAGTTEMPFTCTVMSADIAEKKDVELICLSPVMTVFLSFFPAQMQKPFLDPQSIKPNVLA